MARTDAKHLQPANASAPHAVVDRSATERSANGNAVSLDQQALLGEVLAAVADGRLHPPAPTTRPLAEAGAALRDLLDRHLTGKAVLLPG